MPFDPAPKTKTRFQEFADAMLRGCAVSAPHRFSLWGEADDEANDTRQRACAIGAYYLGMGLEFGQAPGPLASEANEVSNAYDRVYGSSPASDNDCSPYTREQIAARIAALADKLHPIFRD